MSRPDRIPHAEAIAPLFPALGEPKGFVFIFAVGLAGDLLVQRLLNTQPDVCIRGENGDVLSKLMHAWFNTEARTRAEMTTPGANIPGLLREIDALGRRLAATFSETVLAPPVGVRLLGFREVRYLEPQVPITDQLRFLYAFFPNAHFVFCLRDPQAIVRTGWWRTVPRNGLVEQLNHAQESFRSAAADWPSCSCVIQLEDIVQAPATLEPLFRMLNIPFNQQIVSDVLGQNVLDDPEAAL